MEMGIVHDFGKIWCLKWCPSGCEDIDQGSRDKNVQNQFLPRLGLLAAACSDGTIRIFSIPKLSTLQNHNRDRVSLCRAQPRSILTLGHSGLAEENVISATCLSLSWFKGRGHRVIAGAYADGNIAIWDLETKSMLLRTQPNPNEGAMIYPYLYFRAHLTGVKISLDLGTEALKEGLEDEDMFVDDADDGDESCFFPRYLATGASDRVFAVWDLIDGVTAGSMGTILPIRQFRRHLVR